MIKKVLGLLYTYLFPILLSIGMLIFNVYFIIINPNGLLLLMPFDLILLMILAHAIEKVKKSKIQTNDD